jgi:hypothetical protein
MLTTVPSHDRLLQDLFDEDVGELQIAVLKELPSEKARLLAQRSGVRLLRRDRQSRRDGVETGVDNFAARTSHRLTGQLLWRDRLRSEQPGWSMTK